MTYTVYRDAVRREQHKGKGMAAALIIAVAALFMVGMHAATVAAVTAHTFEFTQAELEDNWEADRRAPSGGYESTTAFDRDDVAQLNIDSDDVDSDTFRRTEGIKTTDNFGQAVEVDLYIDSDWEDKAVRAGLWVVGDDGSDDRDDEFGIIEFVNLEPSLEGESASGDHEGWRYWTSAAGWENLETPFAYGGWNTLKIELDSGLQQYNFYINGDQVATGQGGENFIREVFLNSYNYGEDTFPILNSDDYSAHWHGGLAEDVVEGSITAPTEGEVVQGTLNLEASYTGDPGDSVHWAVRWETCSASQGTVIGNVDGFNDPYAWVDGQFSASFDVSEFESGEYCFVFNPGGNQNDVRETVMFTIQKANPADKDECKESNWESMGFRNQGLCVQYANTGRDSR